MKTTESNRPEMPMQLLGNTGLRVSRLCLGTMTFGTQWEHIGTLSQKQATGIVDCALNAGVNFFDTADVYSNGESEEYLGKALGKQRENVIVATKVRGRMSDDVNDIGLTRHHILNSVDASLKRLGTDYIDLYQVHCWDALTPIDETLRALEDLVRWGKVRYIGASNFMAWQLMKALGTSESLGLRRFLTLQPLYNLMMRDIETEIVPLCENENIGILPWSPLAGGFLTGKFSPDKNASKNTRRGASADPFLKFDEDLGFAVVEVLRQIAKAHAGTVAQAALNWLLAKSYVTSVILGARTIEQLQDNLDTVRWQLTAQETERLDSLTSPPRTYPAWFIELAHQRR